MIDRRSFLASAALAAACGSVRAAPPRPVPIRPDFGPLQVRLGRGGRLGVAALEVATGRWLFHDEASRYAMCSTFKLALAADVLAHVDRGALSLAQEIPFRPADLLDYAPVVRANIASAEAPGVWGAFNLGSGSRITINHLINLISEAAGERIIAIAPVQCVVAASADQRVVARPSEKGDEVAAAAIEEIVSSRAIDGAAAAASDDDPLDADQLHMREVPIDEQVACLQHHTGVAIGIDTFDPALGVAEIGI